MNCDRLARTYRWLEYMRYGRALNRCRQTMLPHVTRSQHALAIGDGDGRFLMALAQSNETITVDAVDVSAKMVGLARKRLASSGLLSGSRIALQHGDIRIAEPPRLGYDLIATHFFFDVFSTDELKPVIDRVAGWSRPGAFWIISEFDLPASGWSQAKARFWLRTMYAFFRLTTNLDNQQLPSWRPLLRNAGFIPRRQIRFQNGFLVSELWQQCAETSPLPSYESSGKPPNKASPF